MNDILAKALAKEFTRQAARFCHGSERAIPAATTEGLDALAKIGSAVAAGGNDLRDAFNAALTAEATKFNDLMLDQARKTSNLGAIADSLIQNL